MGRDSVGLAAFAALLAVILAPVLFTAGGAPGNFGDLFLYHFPLRHLVASELQAGRFPFWNPYIFSGNPLFATPQTGLFYPLSAVFQLVPLHKAFSWFTVFHLVLAWVGMFLLGRSRGLRRAHAWALAVAFALSPWLTFRTAQGVPTLLASLAFVPWVWLFFLRDRLLLSALALGLQFLSGHPQFLIANAVGVSIAAAILGRRICVRWFAASALAVAMVVVQAWPTLEFSRRSVRTIWPDFFGEAGAFGWSSWLSLIHPFFSGDPLSGTYSGPPSMFFETGTLYVGWAAAGLALWGLCHARGKALAVLVTLLVAGGLLAIGRANPLFGPFLEGTPLGQFRVPGRFAFLVLWGLLMAAMIGARSLRGHGRGRGMAIALCLVASIDFAFVNWRYHFSQPWETYVAPQEHLKALGPDTPIATSPGVPAPNKAMLYRHRNAAGYEALYLASPAGYHARSQRRAAASGSRLHLVRNDTPEMERLGIRFLIDRGVRENPGAWPSGYLLKGDDPIAAAENPEPLGALRWKRRVPGRQRFEARNPTGLDALAVSAEAFDPGWRGWVRGKEGVRRFAPIPFDGFLLSGRVPPGSSDVFLSYRPPGFFVFLLVSLAAWIFAGALGWRDLAREAGP